MLLTGPKIASLVASGELQITPFNPDNVNPASYDVTLGEEIKVFSPESFPLRVRGSNPVITVHLAKGEEMVLQPGVGYLMHTAEVIGDPGVKYAVQINGKSSLGRVFISIHSTAGFGDPGFCGQYTLEVFCLHPVVIEGGMRIGQALFMETRGEPLSYALTGKYQGQKGATVGLGIETAKEINPGV